MTSRPYTPALLFAILGLSLLAIVLAFANDWQYDQRQIQARQIATLRRELGGQMFEIKRAREVAAEVDELRFLAQSMDATRAAIARAAWKWGRVYRVEPSLILAVIHRESNFDPQAVSYVNGEPCAHGVMQINLSAHPEVDASRIYDIDYNIQQGTRILAECIERYGNVDKALFAYWGGNESRHRYGYPGRVLGSSFFNHGG